jgi:hypothetical protein
MHEEHSDVKPARLHLHDNLFSVQVSGPQHEGFVMQKPLRRFIVPTLVTVMLSVTTSLVFSNANANQPEPEPSGLSISPTLVKFANTPAGTTYPDNFSYALVTITNNSGTDTETLLSADASPPSTFFPTYGGSCNDGIDWDIPPLTSCTFQFGFNPQNKGWYKNGAGSITFASGTVLNVELQGKGR